MLLRMNCRCESDKSSWLNHKVDICHGVMGLHVVLVLAWNMRCVRLTMMRVGVSVGSRVGL